MNSTSAFVCVACFNNNLYLLDPDTGRTHSHFPVLPRGPWNPLQVSDTLVATTGFNSALHMMDFNAQTERWRIEVPGNQITRGLCYVPRFDTVVFGDDEGNLHAGRVETMSPKPSFIHPNAHGSGIFGLAYVSNFPTWVFSRGRDDELKQWDLVKAQEICVTHIYGTATSSHGTLLANMGTLAHDTERGLLFAQLEARTCSVLDPVSRSQVAILRGFDSDSTAMLYLPQVRQLVVCGRDGEVWMCDSRVWSKKTKIGTMVSKQLVAGVCDLPERRAFVTTSFGDEVLAWGYDASVRWSVKLPGCGYGATPIVEQWRLQGILDDESLDERLEFLTGFNLEVRWAENGAVRVFSWITTI